MKGEVKKAEMRDRILAVADRLFYQQGIRTIGVDVIAAQAGISKRTLYNYFPSKDQLVEEYVRGRWKDGFSDDLTPSGQILAYFDRLLAGVRGKGFRGCPFVNAVVELGTRDHPAAQLAGELKERRRQWFEDLLKEENVQNADILSMQISLIVDGVVTSSLVSGDAGYAIAGKDAVKSLLMMAGIDIQKAEPVL